VEDVPVSGIKVDRHQGPLGASLTRATREINSSARQLAQRATVNTIGDLTATGGYRQTQGPWMLANIPADATNNLHFGITTVPKSWVPWRSGSITGFSMYLSAADPDAGDDLVIKILKNGTVLQQLTLKATNTKLVKTFNKDKLTFRAEAVIGITVTSVAGWDNTIDGVAWLEVEM
jgi:hypothetical protein